MEVEKIDKEYCSSLLPCSGTITSDLFLQVVYALILGIGSRLISLGSEYLLEVVSPGIIGGFVLPLLGTLPDAAIIFVSTLGGNVDETQFRLAVGIGSLTGSNIFLITIPWAIAIWRGKCDISPVTKMAKNKIYTKLTWKKTGVSVLSYTPILARIMIMTLFPYLLIQLAFIISTAQKSSINEKEKFWALATSIICFVGFIGYSVYQVYDVRYQEKKLKLARKKFLWEQFFKHMSVQVKNSLKKRPDSRTLSVPPFKKTIKPSEPSEIDIPLSKNIENLPPPQPTQINLIDTNNFNDNPSDQSSTTTTTQNTNDNIYLNQSIDSSNILPDKELEYYNNRLHKSDTQNIKSQRQMSSELPLQQQQQQKQQQQQQQPTQEQLQQQKKDEEQIKNQPRNTFPHRKRSQSQRFETVDDLSPNNYYPHTHHATEHRSHPSMATVFEGLKSKINDLDEDDLFKNNAGDHQVIDLSIDPFAEQPKKKDRRTLVLKAIGSLLLGTALIFLFADAFVETITIFSGRIGIPSFYISFIIAPFALNASELVSNIHHYMELYQ
eukprot:gene7838-9652_t